MRDLFSCPKGEKSIRVGGSFIALHLSSEDAPNSKVLVLTAMRWIQALFRLALAECRSPHHGLPFSGLTAAFTPCPAAGAMYET